MTFTTRRDSTIILYGSYGYTGQLIAKECKSRGLHVLLAGRRKAPLEKQAGEMGYPFQVVDINDTVGLKNLLEKGSVVIHCAGPFQFTARSMVEMCLSTKTHYTDISGEYQVFELLATFDDRAKKAGITVMPGTGFDVVPTDCLALYLKDQLPSAIRLQLAFALSGGGVSRGTAKTMVLGMGDGSVVRKAGKLVHIPLGQKIRPVDFGSVKLKCLNIPWGDVSSAWFSTGIPDIEVYVAASRNTIAAARFSRYVSWLLKAKWFKRLLLKIIDRRISGPERQIIESSSSLLWGSVYDTSGNSKTATIKTMNGYKLTSQTSVLIAEKIAGGNFKPGFQTPAIVYGADFILEIENTHRKNL